MRVSNRSDLPWTHNDGDGTPFNSMNQGVSTLEIFFDENDKAVDYRFIQSNPSLNSSTDLDLDPWPTLVRVEVRVLEMLGVAPQEVEEPPAESVPVVQLTCGFEHPTKLVERPVGFGLVEAHGRRDPV